jgi:hypothetical protein
MRTLLFLLGLGLLISSCDSCAEDFQELSDLCEQTPSTANLLEVRITDFNAMGSKTLNDPTGNIDVCEDHFLSSTPAGHQYNSAANEINRIVGSELHFTNTRVPHLTKSDLYSSSPTDHHFDYVVNNLTVDPGIFPCHPDGGDTLCSSWVMNCCRHNGTDWQGAGNSEFFTVGVNASCYDHFNDPSSIDFPYHHGILHEIAHGWGMNHTGSWDAADKDYISTMQGKLYYLSAADVAYMRNAYPEAMPDHQNYVAGSKTRFILTDTTWKKKVFWEDNPQVLYVDSNGDLLDCATNQAPYFYVSWFNTGNLAGDPDICTVNRIFLRPKYGSGAEIDIHTWKVANMPFLSQDQWEGSTSPDRDEVAQIDFNKTYELVFKVNAWGTQNEITDEDNELSYEVVVVDGSCNQPAMAQKKRERERKYENRKRRFVD